ncbi:MAG: hypothetical protein IT429_25935 [Gemmataceae bacterium]|nr:hypothetical protein [Gemmataceae bacterium]
MSTKRGLLQASLGLAAAVFFVLGLHADQAGRPQGPADKAGFNRDEVAAREKVLASKFREFEQLLLILKQRLEKSPRQEDRDRAAQLQKVLEKSAEGSIGTRFGEMVKFLGTSKLTKVGDVKVLLDQSERLARDLRELLELLRGTHVAVNRKEERKRLEELIKDLERVIRDQKIVNAQMESDMKKTDVARNQRDVRDQTRDLDRKLGKDGKDGQGGEAKDNKGESKEGKGKGAKGESKNSGKGTEGKQGESKNAGKPGEGKKGEAKEGAKGGKQPPNAKAGDKAGQKGEAKPGQQGDKQQGGAKSGAKGGEGAKSGAKGGEKGGEKGGAKGGEKKDEKGGEAKGDGDQSKVRKKEEPGSAKKGEKQAGGAKKGDKQGGEQKSSQSKSGKSSPQQGDAKSSKKSDQGGAKSSGQPSKGGQPPMGGQPPQGGAKGDNNPDSPPPGKEGDNAQQDARKRIQDAEEAQRQAEQKVKEGNKKDAVDKGEKARQELEAAKKKLEDLLRQLREEELERLLTELKARCEKMLAMQIQVYNGTKAVARSIEGNADKKATRANIQDSLGLSDEEKKIVLEASKAIEMLEAEGSAVAFHEVFTQVREDMKQVQRRLGTTDVGKVTQAVEQDIIDTLQEMIKALEKAKKEMDDKKSKPSPPKDSPPPPPQDQKLLDQIAELKMIRAMQIRVNNRTQLYGRLYEGEQANQPNIQQDLRELADRQERIFDVTNKIAKGENK